MCYLMVFPSALGKRSKRLCWLLGTLEVGQPSTVCLAQRVPTRVERFRRSRFRHDHSQLFRLGTRATQHPIVTPIEVFRNARYLTRNTNMISTVRAEDDMVLRALVVAIYEYSSTHTQP